MTTYTCMSRSRLVPKGCQTCSAGNDFLRILPHRTSPAIISVINFDLGLISLHRQRISIVSPPMNNEQPSENNQSSATTTSNTDIKEEERNNAQSTISDNRPCCSKAETRESTAAGMMAVHHPTGETRSGSAQHISGGPNTWHLPKNAFSDGRTDHNLHPTNDSQRFPAHHQHHVSLHIRKSAMTLGTTHSPARGATPLSATTATKVSQLEFNEKDRHFNNHNNMSVGEHNNMCSNENLTGSSYGGVMDDHSESSSSVAHQNNHLNIRAGPSRRKRSYKSKAGSTAGRWTPEEHQAFLEGLKVFGREWKKVAEQIPTRTSAQIRSHAQKYFSKMQREESIILQDQAATAASASHEQAASYETAIVQSEAPHSVRRNVDRILANPNEVQREVEDTLRQLRERYRQLQIRLQETGSTGGGGRRNGLQRARVVEDNTDHYQQQQPPRPSDRRKRILEDNSSFSSPNRYNHQDDLSSISSTVSGFSPTRELASGELIALSVLGASLPRSASNQDLALPAVAEMDVHRQSHNSSPTSTIASSNREATALDGPMDDNSSSDSNKKRKITEDNSAASASCEDDNHGDDGDGSMIL
jgi:SHAQKYF class myb-like DNA-binding protein